MAQAQPAEAKFNPRPSPKLFLSEAAVLAGRYKNDQVLSVSGFGQVYRVSDLRFPGNRWAVKVFPKLPSEAFRAAARAAVSLHHPFLVKTVDFFEEENFSCLVLELVHGKSMENLLEGGEPLPERQVLSWGVQCADTLIYLHRNSPGFHYYRNLSPRKILISSIGELKLLPPFPDWRSEGTARGIMGYAPPEAFDESKPVDEKSDVYALATVLHRCLSGSGAAAVPFVFAPLDPANPNLDSAVERILEKAARANPSRRYKTLNDFRREIFRCLQAVLHIQFDLPVNKGFSDAFWWTVIGILTAALGVWYYIFRIFMAPL